MAYGDDRKSHLTCPRVHDVTDAVAASGSHLESLPQLRHFGVAELEFPDVTLAQPQRTKAIDIRQLKHVKRVCKKFAEIRYSTDRQRIKHQSCCKKNWLLQNLRGFMCDPRGSVICEQHDVRTNDITTSDT